ncbi:MAG: glycoside hydrolase family protein [Pseudomonadota bacterium]
MAGLDAVYLDSIKRFEGFTPTAKWDYAQYTNGFGTKAKFPGEHISRHEAETRFQSEISKARQIVDRVAPQWDEGTKAALTSLTFNAGTKWINAGLGDAVRGGDIEKVREIFVLYNRAGGKVLAGLAARREAEVSWIGSGPQPTDAPSASAVAANPSSAAASITSAARPAEPVRERSHDLAVSSLRYAIPARGIGELATGPIDTLGVSMSAESWAIFTDLLAASSTPEREREDRDRSESSAT